LTAATGAGTASCDAQTDTLQGTWHLVRWEIAYGDGRPTTLPFGAQATGLITYSHDGTMSACIARAGRNPLSSDSVRSAPEAERLAAFESYFQYAGPYAVRQGPDGRQQVAHTVTHALNPNFVGTTQVRNMDFASDGTLTLSAADTVPGTTVARHHRLIWRRPNR
jgi:hypothetical protein